MEFCFKTRLGSLLTVRFVRALYFTCPISKNAEKNRYEPPSVKTVLPVPYLDILLIPSMILALFSFCLALPSRNAVHPKSPSRLFFPLPTTVRRALGFVAGTVQLFPFFFAWNCAIYVKKENTPAVRSKISSKLIFASCV